MPRLTPQPALASLLLALLAATSVRAEDAAVSEKEATAFLQNWLKAQNEGDFPATRPCTLSISRACGARVNRWNV
jgi:hypothetical protein